MAGKGKADGAVIDAHLVAELAAQHLVDGNAISLAGQVPQGDLDGRDATTLPTMAAKLLDAPEQSIDVAGVFAQQAALEHQRIGGAGAVAHFAQSDNALIGVDLYQR